MAKNIKKYVFLFALLIFVFSCDGNREKYREFYGVTFNEDESRYELLEPRIWNISQFSRVAYALIYYGVPIKVADEKIYIREEEFRDLEFLWNIYELKSNDNSWYQAHICNPKW